MFISISCVKMSLEIIRILHSKVAFTLGQITPRKMVVCLLKKIFIIFKWPGLRRIMPRNMLCVNVP